MSRPRFESACVRSRSRQPPPSGPRSSARRSPGLEAAIAALDLVRLDERRAGAAARRTAELATRTELNVKTERLIAARSQAEEELTDAAGAREATTAALYRLRSDAERLTNRREAAAGLSARFAADLAAAEAFDPDEADGLLETAREASSAAQAAVADRTTAQLAAEERWARLAGAEWARHAALAAELEELALARTEIQRDLLGGGRDSLLALRDAAQRIGHSLESLSSRRAELAADLAETGRGGPSPATLGRAADEADAAARAAIRERDDLKARAELATRRLAALDQSLSEREGLPPAARALVEDGEQLALSALEVPAGDERAVAAALGRLASAVVADDPTRGLELIERARTGGLGSLVVLVGRDPAQIVGGLPVVAAADLLDSPGAAVTREGIGWDPARGELWFAGETAEAVLLELEARRRAHIVELEELDRVVEEAVAAAESGRGARRLDRGRLRPGGASARPPRVRPAGLVSHCARRRPPRRDPADRSLGRCAVRGAACRACRAGREEHRRGRGPRARASPGAERSRCGRPRSRARRRRTGSRRLGRSG